jgi:hypothetical protein
MWCFQSFKTSYFSGFSNLKQFHIGTILSRAIWETDQCFYVHVELPLNMFNFKDSLKIEIQINFIMCIKIVYFFNLENEME